MKGKISKMSVYLAAAALSLTGLLSADTTYVQVGTGYRQDSLTSSNSLRSSLNPRAKSHLHYKDIEIVLITAKAKTTFGCCESYARADFDYGWVLDGKLREGLSLKNRDDNSELSHNGYVEEGEFLNIALHNDVSNNSFVWDFDFAFVYPTHCLCDDLIIGPAIGFTVNSQHLKAKSRVNVHDAHFSSSLESDFELDNSSRRDNKCGHRHGHSQRTTWWGPWLGFDFTYDSHNCWNLYGEVEIHIGRVRHDRSANLNIGTLNHHNSTKSFWGPSFKLGTTYMFCQDWYFDASVFYSKYWTYNSRKDVKWATGNVRIDVGYTF